MRASANIFLLCLLLLMESCNKQDTCEQSDIFIDGNKRGRKVLIIGIDGFRSDAMQQHISPFLYNLSQLSDTYYNDAHQVEKLTFSGPNWTSILTGVHIQKHQVGTNELGYHKLHEYPHFFNYIELADSRLNTVSLSSWIIINERIVSGNADYAKTYKYADEDVYLAALQILREQIPIVPDVMFVSFHELDGAGHDYGFSANQPEYVNTLSRIDAYINDVVSVIEAKRQAGEDWLLIVVSDHGGDNKSHKGGYGNVNIRNTIFYANHPMLTFNHSHRSAQVDVVPTVLDYLGIVSLGFNCKTDGVSLIK
ncbi:alkaline phosphatase family protein [Carboxylicivirga marina]|uniref:alkaline phosphatase family protein n=1 Tax=Carboxylicivirga marina TaxID=2800988 RepID=UPI002597A669|nr:alkaline phosphatase family protein [uncultured Carboxylicivirga sp.]